SAGGVPSATSTVTCVGAPVVGPPRRPRSMSTAFGGPATSVSTGAVSLDRSWAGRRSEPASMTASMRSATAAMVPLPRAVQPPVLGQADGAQHVDAPEAVAVVLARLPALGDAPDEQVEDDTDAVVIGYAAQVAGGREQQRDSAARVGRGHRRPAERSPLAAR